MQVEYESSPPVDPAYSEGVSFRPGDAGPAGGDSDEEEEPAGQPGKKTAAKPKRIIKQRQSLAEKPAGTSIFPVARVKRIVKADGDVEIMSNEAVFMVSVAAEYFVKHFMEEGLTKARLEKRKLVTYKDMANVVARSEEFDFLKDVIPAPMPLSEALLRRKQKAVQDEAYDDGPDPSTTMNDEDLPPLIPSTNPLFPNAVVKKPANTHAKTAQPKGRGSVAGPGSAGGGEGKGVGGGAESEGKGSVGPTGGEKKSSAAPHPNSTRKSARRSTLGGDVDMSEVAELREGARRESVAVSDAEEMDQDEDEA
ncbi:hypothetical protein IAT38_001088 [Cryptococcus sp. DSM 104549]